VSNEQLNRQLIGYLSEKVERLEKELANARFNVTCLTQDVQILTEELERARQPKMDER
jgi:archaellum component FlaC